MKMTEKVRGARLGYVSMLQYLIQTSSNSISLNLDVEEEEEEGTV